MRLMWIMAAGVMGLGLLCTCAGPGASAGSSAMEASSGFVRGTARVISVNEAIGQAVLDVDGTRIYGYWQKEAYTAQPGARVDAGPLKPPVGDYREVQGRNITFPAKAGQTIEFVGLRTGNDIFLRGVAVVSR